MLDRRLRRTVDPVLISAAAVLHRRGIGADAVTMAACLIGLTGAGLIAAGHPLLGLAGFLLGRLLDGLDGALARMTAPTDRGGFLDIVLDFLVYGAVPLAFAFLDPARNALAAAVLLASFLVNGIALMAFALMDERRGVCDGREGRKVFPLSRRPRRGNTDYCRRRAVLPFPRHLRSTCTRLCKLMLRLSRRPHHPRLSATGTAWLNAPGQERAFPASHPSQRHAWSNLHG